MDTVEGSQGAELGWIVVDKKPGRGDATGFLSALLEDALIAASPNWPLRARRL